ncbi:transposable element Tcb1 transposase [Trichonephila clavipes]|nr:transposable element Tcb1 transposase [Trichonephila clavipes]
MQCIFQQDNARPHTERVSQYCLRTMTTLPWSTRSPDLSPIEHMWDRFGRRVRHPTSLNELEAKLQQIFNEMSQDIMQNLYVSMPDRIAPCIRARGGSTGRGKCVTLFGGVRGTPRNSSSCKQQQGRYTNYCCNPYGKAAPITPPSLRLTKPNE